MPSAPARSSSLIRTARSLCATLIDLAYPQDCCGCGAPLAPGTQAAFCPSCTTQLRVLSEPLCAVCGCPLGSQHSEPRCLRCNTEPPAFSRARSWAYYSTDTGEKNPLARAVWALKYSRRLDVGRRLARLLADNTPFEAAEHDLVVPVPLHNARLRRRGFNHACILAAAVARHIRAPLASEALRRIRATPSQVSLPEAARATNVRGAFAVADPFAIARRRIVLVDDVYTTGATVTECATALRTAGAAAVDVLTLARAVRC